MNAQRLMRLARFLHNELPPEKFYFGRILKGHDIPEKTFSCGTVGCAIGWAPIVFPRSLEYFLNGWSPAVRKKGGRKIFEVTVDHAAKPLRDFFGLSEGEAIALFVPLSQSTHELPDLSFAASAKEVASNIALFVSRKHPKMNTAL